jgi:hypothetical protein
LHALLHQPAAPSRGADLDLLGTSAHISADQRRRSLAAPHENGSALAGDLLWHAIVRRALQIGGFSPLYVIDC